MIYFEPAHFYPFLTHWNHTSHLLYFLTTAYLSLRSYFGRRGLGQLEWQEGRSSGTYQPSATLLRMAFVLMQHCWAWTVLVVVVYWSARETRQQQQ